MTKDQCINIIHLIDKSKYCPLLCKMLDYYQVNSLCDLSEKQANDYVNNRRWIEFPERNRK